MKKRKLRTQGILGNVSQKMPNDPSDTPNFIKLL
jgi:hypothetical protein